MRIILVNKQYGRQYKQIVGMCVSYRTHWKTDIEKENNQFLQQK